MSKILISFSHQSFIKNPKIPINTTFREHAFKKFFNHYIMTKDTFLISDEIDLDNDHKAVLIKNHNRKTITVTIYHLHHNKKHTITLKPKETLLFVHDKLRGIDRKHQKLSLKLIKEINLQSHKIKILQLKLNDFDVQYRYLIIKKRRIKKRIKKNGKKSFVKVTKEDRVTLIKSREDLSKVSPRVLSTIKRLLLKYPLP